jgi:arabinose-5-phosphate isomerase
MAMDKRVPDESASIKTEKASSQEQGAENLCSLPRGSSLASQLIEMGALLAEQLTHLSAQLPVEALERLSREIVQAPAVALIGIGKSGLIAEKIAATLSSLGVRAFSIHATEAQHGHLGLIQRDDVVLMLSKSGESEELLSVIPSLKHRGVRLWAMTSTGPSRLRSAVKETIDVPALRELDPHDTIPTTSTLIQLLLGDLLAMAVYSLRGTSLEDFQVNHPAGRIGRRLHLRVRDLMLPLDRTPKVSESLSVMEILAPLSEGCSGCVTLLGQNGCITGVFTDGDLRRALERGGSDALHSPVIGWASKTPRCTSPDRLAIEALRDMEADSSRPISVMPVVEEKTLVGLLRLHDLIQAGL